MSIEADVDITMDIAGHAAQEAHATMVRICEALPDPVHKATAYAIAAAMIGGKAEAHAITGTPTMRDLIDETRKASCEQHTAEIKRLRGELADALRRSVGQAELQAAIDRVLKR